MMLWPYKQLQFESKLKKAEIRKLLEQITDQDNKSIYWGKRFTRRFWGKVQGDSFRIRPVVAYWNLSPVELKGSIIDLSDEKNGLYIKMTCPYLRIVVPLVVLGVVLFFFNLGIDGDWITFALNSLIMLAGAYLLVNIPFQIQAMWSTKDLINTFGKRIYRVE